MDQDDYAEARRRMIDGQLRPNRVSDKLLLAAIRDLPRERFVPAPHRARAHADEEIPLAPGRTLPTPMATARLLQLLQPRAGTRALVVACGAGYAATLLAMLELEVVAIEDQAPLLALAREALGGLPPRVASRVRLVAGDPTKGEPDGAPYDLILIEGMIPRLPEPLAAQLAPAGRMAGVVPPGRAMLGRNEAGRFGATPAFDLAIGPLPAFAPKPGFTF